MIRDLTYVGKRVIPAPLDGPALRYALLPKANVDAIAVHHWTGWLPPETWTEEEEIAYILRIDQWHRNERGLDGIGYQLCPFPSGRVYVTSRLDRYGGHVGGENNHLIGIGLPGTFSLRPPSARHLAATVEAVRYVYGYLGREVSTLPHRYWGGTTCPGDLWRQWVPQLERQATEEDIMADFSPEQKAYLEDFAAEIGRGLGWCVTDGGMSEAMKRGDPTWKPPHHLGEVLQAIARIPIASGVRVSDEQLKRVLKPIVEDALKDMAKAAGS